MLCLGVGAGEIILVYAVWIDNILFFQVLFVLEFCTLTKSLQAVQQLRLSRLVF